MKEIAIVGLDNAGKTTILYRMKHHATVETIPTIGFNVESFKVHGTTFNVWDIGGQDEIRPLWHSYIEMASGIVFVIDIVDSDRWEKAGMELRKIISDGDYRRKLVLILANKADDPNDPSLDRNLSDMVARLGIKQGEIEYAVFHVAAKENPNNLDPLERLVPAFEWMVDELKKINS